MTTENEFDQLEWVHPSEDIFSQYETTGEKFVRKFKENPFVPIGALVTSGILYAGVRNILTGNRKYSQNLMRARVIAQGLTFVAIIGGFLLNQKKK